MDITKTIAAGAAAICAFSTFADFEIDLDFDATPIRDMRKSTCFPMVGYAGCLANTDEACWFSSNKVETARAMREAGAWFQRMWSANSWFKNRRNWHDPNSKDPKEQKAYKNFRPTHPELMFPFWKENGIKVLFTLECWSDDGEKSAVEFVKWIVDNGYKDVVAGFEMGNESYFSKDYPALAPRWKRVIDELWKIWPKVPLGVVLCELFEENPDLTQVRGRMLSAGEIKSDGYFSASVFNRYTTQFVVAMSNYMDKVSHVIYHAYGAETPYSCSYYGFQRFRNYIQTMPELKGKQMWLSEIRMRSDEDDWCQRQFREALIMGHYALTSICQTDFDGYNQHEFSSWSGGLFLSNGKQFAHQWRTGCWYSGYPDYRSPYDKPRLEAGPMGVMYRVLTEGIKSHPIILQHGTSKETGTEDTFYTSARVTDEVYRHRRAIREGKKPFLGLFGGVPEVKGEVEWVALRADANRGQNATALCLLMVNSKNEPETATLRVKGRFFATPTYQTVSCPEEFVDCSSVPGDAHPWKELSWEDSQQGGFDAIKMAMYEGIQPKNDELKITVGPHTVQAVTVWTRAYPKPKPAAKK